MNANMKATRRRMRKNSSGLSLVELLVAMAIGLIISLAVGTVFVSSRGGATRQAQLSGLQQDVRTAFDYLARDARMIGHLGCYTGAAASASGFNNHIAGTDITNNYQLGVEGYDFQMTGSAYTITSATPANTTSATNWRANVAVDGISTLPLTTIAGTGTGNGLTPGSDVLVIRTVSSGPVRLTADAGTNANIAIENPNPNPNPGTCSDNTTAKVSGFCRNSHALIASCARARLFSVASIAGNTLTANVNLASTPAYTYVAAATEVFPMQTVAYYVKASSSGRTTSLYRRIFDGDNAAGLEQELIEGVEMLQVRYGVDLTTPDADGVIDEYRQANDVADWRRVVAVRMGLLIRAADSLDPGVVVPTTGIVNGVTVTYPTTTRGFDRRIFTTTVAVRNRISFL
jgi:type IV pilus assembly protein PilW